MTSADWTPLRVLFLCTENAARSQIAEALLHRKGGWRFIAASAGTAPAAEPHAEALAALAEAGITWRGRPKSIDTVSGESWDFVITLCDRAREECATLGTQPTYAHWSTPDPASCPPTLRSKAFSDTVALLARRIDLMLALPPESLESAAAAERLRAIARTTDATTTAAREP